MDEFVVVGSTGADGIWTTTLAEVVDKRSTSWAVEAVGALASGATALTPSRLGEAQLRTTKKKREIADRVSTATR